MEEDLANQIRILLNENKKEQLLCSKGNAAFG